MSLRLAAGCRANLRTRRLYRVVYRAFCVGRDRFGFRIVQYAVGRRSLRLICEAADARALSRGMQGFNVRVARRLNAVLGRRGRVFADRYAAVELTIPVDVRGALARVFAPPSGARVPVDACSSAAHFDGWARACWRWVPAPRAGAPPVARPRTRLLRIDWRRHGAIDPRRRPR